MKRTVLFAISAILSVVLLFESGIASSLLAFLLVGAVPGTNISISPNIMLAVIAAITWLFFMHTTVLGTFNLFTIKRLIEKHTARRERLPKRRYGQI